MELKNAIVLVFDGLHNGFSGAYGNAGIATPALDRFACDSLLCDRYYADTLELSLLCREYWFGIPAAEPETGTVPLAPSLPARLREKGYRTILLTDDSEVAYDLYADGFSEVHRIDASLSDQPAASLEETRFFRLFATEIDLVAQNEEPYFLWAHFKAFAGPWDFPDEYRDEQVEEGDPEPYSGTIVPRFDDRSVDSEPDPDVLRSVVETYTAGITVLDESLAGFVESLQGGELGAKTLCILTGARGFSMGEHRLIGLPEPGDLWGENLHLPLLVRFPEQYDSQRMVRTSALTQPSDLYATLAEWFDCGNDNAGQSLVRFLADEETPIRDEIRIVGDSQIQALMQSDWFFRIRSETDEIQGLRQKVELYAKPDDRYEVNEVADRCEDIVEEWERLPLRGEIRSDKQPLPP